MQKDRRTATAYFHNVGVLVYYRALLVVDARVAKHQLEIVLELVKSRVVTVSYPLLDLVEADGPLDDVVIIGKDLLAGKFFKDL